MIFDTSTFTSRVWYVIMATAIMIAVGYIVYVTSAYLLVILAGLIFGCVASAAIDKVRIRSHLPRTAAFFLVWLGLLGVPALLLSLTLPSVEEQFNDFGAIMAEFERTGSRLLTDLPGGEWLLQRIYELDTSTVVEEGVFSGQLGGILVSISSGIVSAVLLLFIALYVSFDPRKYLHRLRSVMPWSRHEALDCELRAVRHTLSWWFMGRLASMVVVFTLTYLGLLLLGVELSFLLALLAGMLSFVPNIGPLLSVIPAILVALTQGGSLVIWVLGLYLSVQTIESYFITPFIELWAVSTPPALLLGLQVVMGVLFGVVGILLAGPILAILITLLDRRSVRHHA